MKWNGFLYGVCPPNTSSAIALRHKAKCNTLQGVPLTPHVSFCVCMGLALGSMSCRFWFCLSWFKDGFACTAPTVLLVHWSTNLWRSSVKVPFLLLLLFACTCTCSVVCGRGSGYATRLFVDDPKTLQKDKNRLKYRQWCSTSGQGDSALQYFQYHNYPCFIQLLLLKNIFASKIVLRNYIYSFC